MYATVALITRIARFFYKYWSWDVIRIWVGWV